MTILGTFPETRGSPFDPIEAVECFDCAVPLPHPLKVGSMSLTERTYAVLRLHSHAGFDGAAYAYGRGLPVAAVIRQALAPVLLGVDSRRPEHIRELMGGAHWPYGAQGILPVAASAVDLALWDILGKRLGAPLADLLGRRRNAVPVCGVAGYVRAGTDDFATLEAELRSLVEQGVRSFKLTIGAGTPEWDAQRIEAARSVIGRDCPVAVDAFRSFRNLEDAVRRLELLKPYDLAFVEDPFPDTLAPLLHELRRRTGLSIAVGENISDHRSYRPLFEAQAFDVVRCDATVVGGVREFMAVSALASAHGLEIATHVHPEIHVHFAAAIPNLYSGGLEYMTQESGLDPFHRLLSSHLELCDGQVITPDRPGLGLDFDWQKVKEFSRG